MHAVFVLKCVLAIYIYMAHVFYTLKHVLYAFSVIIKHVFYVLRM